MTQDARSKWLRHYMDKWAAAPEGSFDEALYKSIVLMLGYGAGVRKTNLNSRKLRAEGI